MKNSFRVSYVTTLPKEGNAPRVTITGIEPKKYHVSFHEISPQGLHLLSSGYCETNQTIIAKVHQWYTPWGIRITDETNKVVFTDTFDLLDETVFIKMDAYALGDSIAWIPYVEEFRKKHRCRVICSTFHNSIFVAAYPHILFVQPNTVIENVYAQYYIGASNDNNPYYSPIKVNQSSLQMVACKILGLPSVELRPDLRGKYEHIPKRINERYVTLSEFGSASNKQWKASNGWQQVVDYLNSYNLKVVVISKEKTTLTGVIDLSGDYSLDERAIDLMYAEFHLGISSGLSWLAWAMGTHTVMISDVTPSWHEFQTDITRLNASNLQEVNYSSDSQTTVEEVLKKLGEMVV